MQTIEEAFYMYANRKTKEKNAPSTKYPFNAMFSIVSPRYSVQDHVIVYGMLVLLTLHDKPSILEMVMNMYILVVGCSFESSGHPEFSPIQKLHFPSGILA
jgi:hypothetical protein